MNVSDVPSKPDDSPQYGLRVSTHDRVASMLIALLILFGMAVGLLFLLWLSSRVFVSQASVPVILEEIGEEGGSLGESDELDAPELEETDLDQVALQDTLATIADAVATKAALLNDPSFDSESRPGRSGTGGRGSGSGPGRPGKRRHWELSFIEGNTLETYARQLDFFKIELGVLMPGNKVEYASNLSKSKPDRRTGPADKEKRYYLTWRQGELQQADKDLLAKAGIKPGNQLILKFIPPETETQLVLLERERAKMAHKDAKVRSTHFGVRAEGNGFAFYVMDQSYRR